MSDVMKKMSDVMKWLGQLIRRLAQKAPIQGSVLFGPMNAFLRDVMRLNLFYRMLLAFCVAQTYLADYLRPPTKEVFRIKFNDYLAIRR
jgi:hypothetical protein